jgi:hypothetical protein
MPADSVPEMIADVLAGLPDAVVTVADSGCVIARLPGDVAFYVSAR